MAVKRIQNFWLRAKVDGRVTEVSTGPSGADGGFCLSIMIRDHGQPRLALQVNGIANPDGTLELRIVPDPYPRETGSIVIRSTR